MPRTNDLDASAPLSEMAIVDTFTKLIFGQERHYNDGELLIIEALRLVDASVAMDSYEDMGHYLRCMGVEEMIQLVTRVQRRVNSDARFIASESGESARDRRTH